MHASFGKLIILKLLIDASASFSLDPVCKFDLWKIQPLSNLLQPYKEGTAHFCSSCSTYAALARICSLAFISLRLDQHKLVSPRSGEAYQVTDKVCLC